MSIYRFLYNTTRMIMYQIELYKYYIHYLLYILYILTICRQIFIKIQ